VYICSGRVSLCREIIICVVKLFWINDDDEWRLYKTLKFGESHRQHTYIGHLWLIATANDDVPIVLLSARASRCRVLLRSVRPLLLFDVRRFQLKTTDLNDKTVDFNDDGASKRLLSNDGALLCSIVEHNVVVERLKPQKQQLTKTVDGNKQYRYTLLKASWSNNNENVLFSKYKGNVFACIFALLV
jgi:hypothetical protein